MKLNKDNYELILFDLLEGNLPEEESIQLMQQIEEDEFFFNEWKLLKHTVLQPEETVVYAKKQDLLKPEQPRIIPFYTIGAIAASVVILLAVFFYFNKDETTTAELPIAVEEVVPQTPPTVENTEDTKTVVPEALDVEAPAMDKTSVIPSSEKLAEIPVETKNRAEEKIPLETPELMEEMEKQDIIIAQEDKELPPSTQTIKQPTERNAVQSELQPKNIEVNPTNTKPKCSCIRT
jgi:hypothetical protein